MASPKLAELRARPSGYCERCGLCVQIHRVGRHWEARRHKQYNRPPRGAEWCVRQWASPDARTRAALSSPAAGAEEPTT